MDLVPDTPDQYQIRQISTRYARSVPDVPDQYQPAPDQYISTGRSRAPRTTKTNQHWYNLHGLFASGFGRAGETAPFRAGISETVSGQTRPPRLPSAHVADVSTELLVAEA
eukprot:1092393-Rhodomonas_salina.4